MPDKFSTEVRSKIMSKIKSKDTLIEMSIRKILTENHISYHLHKKEMTGRPDIYIAKYRTAIFVNGCFWHMHNCDKFSYPKSNIEFWKTKLRHNFMRDLRTIKKLKKEGYKVLTVWECAWSKNVEDSEKLIAEGILDFLKTGKKTLEIAGKTKHNLWRFCFKKIAFLFWR